MVKMLSYSGFIIYKFGFLDLYHQINARESLIWYSLLKFLMQKYPTGCMGTKTSQYYKQPVLYNRITECINSISKLMEACQWHVHLGANGA